MSTDVQFFPRDCWTAHGERKVTFETRRAARTAADALNWGAPHAYRCPYQCHGWHLGRHPEYDSDEEE